MALSKRMEAVAGLVTPGNSLADIGTDHGYVPIELVKRGIVPRAIAMDLRTGPLDIAKEHIRACGLSGQIETRLSDGVEALTAGEVESIVIAGMGGGLVLHILEHGENVCKQANELILQPQSELALVREYLWTHGYEIDREDMVYEEGKYYPMMHVLVSSKVTEPEEAKRHIYAKYGQRLIEQSHPVLGAYLNREHEQYEKILAGLYAQSSSEKVQNRIYEMEKLLKDNEKAKELMGL